MGKPPEKSVSVLLHFYAQCCQKFVNKNPKILSKITRKHHQNFFIAFLSVLGHCEVFESYLFFAVENLFFVQKLHYFHENVKIFSKKIP